MCNWILKTPIGEILALREAVADSLATPERVFYIALT